MFYTVKCFSCISLTLINTDRHACLQHYTLIKIVFQNHNMLIYMYNVLSTNAAILQACYKVVNATRSQDCNKVFTRL